MAKIELVARPVNILGYEELERLEIAPQHLFVMITNDMGMKSVITAGPEEFGSKRSMIWDDIKVRKQGYFNSEEKGYESYFKLKLLIEGRDQEINPYIEKIWNKASEINKSGFDYKLPLFGDEQNSNTVARIITESAGLEFRLPTYESGKPVLALSYDEEIDYSEIDKSGIGNKIKEFLYAKDMMRKLSNKINKVYERYVEKIKSIKECMDKLLKEKEEDQGKLEEEIGIVDKLFGYFDNPQLYKEGVDNKERFRISGENAMQKGEIGFANIFAGLENQQRQVEKLFEFMDQPGFKNAKSAGAGFKYLSEGIDEIRRAQREEIDLGFIASEFKGHIAELDAIFEKCIPGYFYDEL